MDCSPPGSSDHGILQARILEWVFRGSFWLRSNPGLLHCRQILYHLSHQGSPLIDMLSVSVWFVSSLMLYPEHLISRFDAVFPSREGQALGLEPEVGQIVKWPNDWSLPVQRGMCRKSFPVECNLYVISPGPRDHSQLWLHPGHLESSLQGCLLAWW